MNSSSGVTRIRLETNYPANKLGDVMAREAFDIDVLWGDSAHLYERKSLCRYVKASDVDAVDNNFTFWKKLTKEMHGELAYDLHDRFLQERIDAQSAECTERCRREDYADKVHEIRRNSFYSDGSHQMASMYVGPKTYRQILQGEGPSDDIIYPFPKLARTDGVLGIIWAPKMRNPLISLPKFDWFSKGFDYGLSMEVLVLKDTLMTNGGSLDYRVIWDEEYLMQQYLSVTSQAAPSLGAAMFRPRS